MRGYGIRTGIICLAVSMLGGKLFTPTVVLSAGDENLRPSAYSGLLLENTEELSAQSGVKSVLFNAQGTKLYALNLEGMSIYEFDRVSRQKTRVFIFKPTEAPGWDYRTNMAVPSFAEKPVEACFSHEGKILWVSLHNAGGIVPIRMDSVSLDRSVSSGRDIYLRERPGLDTISVPLIRTGRTPKVITPAGNSRFLLVSNWHSRSVSILRINGTITPYAEKITDISMKGIPRGIAVDNRNGRSYVTIMSGNSISVINNRTFKVERNIPVAYNPRHILADSLGRLFVSFNASDQLACISAKTGKVLFKVATHSRPRTIVLSKNQKFIFVTCYEGDRLDIFRIEDNSFSRIASIGSGGKPVGADIYEDQEKLEVWVCNYLSGKIKIFTFKKV